MEEPNLIGLWRQQCMVEKQFVGIQGSVRMAFYKLPQCQLQI
jgi:hypothetical protein